MTDKINEGDYVLLYLDNKRTYLVRVERGKNFHMHKGFIRLDDLINNEYGSSILSNTGVKFIALKPTLCDYVLKSVRRTQITYPKDIALIITLGGIGPGNLVVEAGTGTGALTCALAYYVRPNGRVYSYEVRSEFIDVALKNIRRAGLAEYVEIKNKDITEGIDEKEVDAVVLDMATPWLVIPYAYASLKPSGAFISFSPTVDQVVKTVEALNKHNFVRVETIECLLRRMIAEPMRTRPETLMTAHTGYLTFARKAL